LGVIIGAVGPGFIIGDVCSGEVCSGEVWIGAVWIVVDGELRRQRLSFGRRRLFNGTYATYHAGIDYAGRVGREIFAPAGGRIVFTGSQDVCGTATVIDHGWGIFSRICHQDSVSVQTGQTIVEGERIGTIGRSGRVTGPHLHWEIWVGGVQVDPQQWLDELFP